MRSEKIYTVDFKKLRWEKYLNDSQTFAIQAAVHSDYFTTNSHYISLKSKDAIADYFRHKYSRRPSVDLKHPHLRIHIHINKDYCQVS